MSALRRIKPVLNDDEEDENFLEEPSAEYGAEEDKDEDVEMNSGSENSDEEDDEDEEEPIENPQALLSKISFGALSKAATSLRALPSSTNAPNPREAALAALATLKSKSKPKHASEIAKRTSKHAPTELSSKRAVTRKRTVVELPATAKARDPRFDSAVKGVFSEEAFKKNYGFLEGYRDDEVTALKGEMKATKDEERREELKKKVESMESRKKTDKAKEKRESVLRELKKKEREAVKMGKKPFYLKKSEQKKAVLVEQFKGLSEKQVEKVMEKRRKRKAQKERKSMPFERREI
ncbi:rRNA biogenesis protein rrp36 [Rhizina undulata]